MPLVSLCAHFSRSTHPFCQPNPPCLAKRRFSFRLHRIQKRHPLAYDLSSEQVFGDEVQPVDVVVTDRERFEKPRNTPNTLAFEAATTGRMYGDTSCQSCYPV